jgi:TrmH family RNA methyltransferase
MIRPAVVLVRPENGANIGSVARVMKNTGLKDLRLVEPSDWRTIETWRTAWASQEILERARVFKTLDEALRGSTMALALSGRDDQVAVLDVREGVRQIGTAPEGASTCLVFGPEQSGLTFEEMARCGRRASIPSHPAHPSFNLSHAVAITAYECFRLEPQPRPGHLLSYDDRQKLALELEIGLRAVGAIRKEKERYSRLFRGFLTSLDLSVADARWMRFVGYCMERAARDAGYKG